MNAKMLPTVGGALVTVSKGLEKWLEELETRRRIETIQTTAIPKIG